ncbi:MAG: alpha/beta hydrolase [Lachnospiraceae bacterium]|nr:alpha/beta hydrolase [Lachnospiraceae bacterium]
MIKTAAAGDIRMDYAVFGNGEKILVIIPGLSLKSVLQNEKAIEEAYACFKESYTVYLFDRRVHDSSCTIDDLAEETALVMKALGLRDAFLFGASQGGMMAQVIALKYPELVKKLVLGSTLSRTVEEQSRKIKEWIRLAERKAVKELAESSARLLYSENTLELFGEAIQASLQDPSEEELLQFRMMAEAAASFDVLDRLQEIACPVLVIGSLGDKLIPPEAQLLTAKQAHGELFLYDASYGHAVYDEAPDYKARLMEFFERP